MKCFQKFLWAIGFSALGIISIPLITLPIHPNSIEMFELSLFTILLGYFLPGSVFVMVLAGEILKRITPLNPVFEFISSRGIYKLFFLSVIVCWTFVLTLPPSNDLIFGSQFIAGLILPFHFYLRKSKDVHCF